MYEFNGRVRFSETDTEGRLTYFSLINYFQDASIFHSESGGYPMKRFLSERASWFIKTWDIYIERLPELYENIIIGTEPKSYRGILAERNFWLKDPEGRYLVKAVSVWFLMDLDTMRPRRLNDDCFRMYGDLSDCLNLSEPGKIELPDLEKKGEIPVQEWMLDSNMHMNNARYIELALNALKGEPLSGSAAGYLSRIKEESESCYPSKIKEESEPVYPSRIKEESEPVYPSRIKAESKSFYPSRIKAEYRKAAHLGDLLIPFTGKKGNDSFVSLRSASGETYANIYIG